MADETTTGTKSKKSSAYQTVGFEGMEEADPKKRAAAAGLNPEGINTDPDPGLEKLQERVDKWEEQGYIGITPDPTPPENYTLQTPQDAPTPETDPELFEKARLAALGNPLKNIEESSVQTAKREEK